MASAIRNLLGGDEAIRRCRRPEIMADAAHAILLRDSRDCTGRFFIDDEVLAEEGVTDFSRYADVTQFPSLTRRVSNQCRILSQQHNVRQLSNLARGS